MSPPVRGRKGTGAPINGSVTATAHARLVLDSLGREHLHPALDERAPGLLWAQSGAMWLSGHADGPARACPAPLAACAQGAWLALSALLPQHCDPRFDAYRLLGERAAIAGLARRGRVSAGGACRLLDMADGVLALNLARDEDRELLPAWLEQPAADTAELVGILRGRRTVPLLQRARVLGLAAAAVVPPRPCRSWFRATRHATARRAGRDAPLVIDLSSLWAGPLCAQLLSRCGARVIKVESTARPDGARSGPARFHDLLNAGKESVALDLREAAGRARLRALLAKADIVIESSRPRALEQMGIRSAELLAERPGMVWLGITGYGRRAPMRDWIAYGDDAGVAAGLAWLMGREGEDPVFCADAIADPLTGLHAAPLALASWLDGGGQLLDIALHDVAAFCAARCVPEPCAAPAEDVALPSARVDCARAAELGADTSRVLREFA